MRFRACWVLLVWGCCSLALGKGREEAAERIQVRIREGKPLLVHVVVALCDNEHQGIVPVPKQLGDGEDPDHNLYWGALYGVRTTFGKAESWQQVWAAKPDQGGILERILFRGRVGDSVVLLLAEAYRGEKIRSAIEDFLGMLAGTRAVEVDTGEAVLRFGAGADLVVYAGHDGLMDFGVTPLPAWQDGSGRREAMVIACASKTFFAEALRSAGAFPLLWSTGLMTAEAYTLKAAVEAWAQGGSPGEIRERAAAAYAKYQKCGLKAARRLLVSGW